MHLDPSFKSELPPQDLQQMSQSPDIYYVIDSGFCLRGFNEAWVSFARQNGGEKVLQDYPIGRSIMDAVPGVLKDYFQRAYEEALQKNNRFDHDFLCSSPVQMRKFHQTAYPLKNGEGLLICNHLSLENITSQSAAALSSSHRNAHKFIVQCAHCRCIQNHKSGGWDWIPELVASSRTDISHGLCPRCYEFYYRDFLPKS